MIENNHDTTSPEVVKKALLQLKESLEHCEATPEAQEALRTIETALREAAANAHLSWKVLFQEKYVSHNIQLNNQEEFAHLQSATNDDEYIHRLSRPMVLTTWNRLSRALISHVSNMSDSTLIRFASRPTDEGVLVDTLSEVLLEDAVQLSAKEKAELRGARAKKQWLEERGGSLTALEVGDLLGVKRQTVNDKRVRGEILGLPVGNQGYRYPVWQFTNGKPLPGLKTILRVLREAGHSEWAQLRFFLGDNEFLKVHHPDTPTPIDALKAGNIEATKQASTIYMTQITT